jgi:hypothetical protein
LRFILSTALALCVPASAMAGGFGDVATMGGKAMSATQSPSNPPRVLRPTASSKMSINQAPQPAVMVPDLPDQAITDQVIGEPVSEDINALAPNSDSQR